jgi:hypothetical protein
MARTTVRLHPRRGDQPGGGSKIGGSFVWPSNERWPVCDEHESSFVTALQLRKDDVPHVRFKDESDLLQVLWCPNDHEPLYVPRVQVFWRTWADVKDSVGSPPKPIRSVTEYVPRPCSVHPEPVVEYPHIGELSEELTTKIDHAEELKQLLQAMPPPKDVWRYPHDARSLYQFWLSTAAGTKVGGYPGWIQEPEYPPCPCGATMELLVTFASWEFDGISWGRWLPLDERAVLTASYETRTAVQSGANWMFGDAGSLYLFVCRDCEQWPTTALMQSS